MLHFWLHRQRTISVLDFLPRILFLFISNLFLSFVKQSVSSHHTLYNTVFLSKSQQWLAVCHSATTSTQFIITEPAKHANNIFEIYFLLSFLLLIFFLFTSFFYRYAFALAFGWISAGRGPNSFRPVERPSISIYILIYLCAMAFCVI